ncbi:MAG TPA: 5'-3' exonuclease [Metalysinibacillus jejuensis]|uniref:5'-3' exonuclease n=1 Tax=Metalysinibacillus jejuensis TaxID=914327 RepID=A0A921N9I5_9BACL|nr:5'-3' exonuclease [Metalysinibacillus jejuensis]
MKPKLLIIDGMALLFRSYFASAAMGHFIRLPDGTPSNGAQGFARHVITANRIFKPDYMAICWDMGAVTFRNDIYDGYKANRPAPPEEMLPQFDMAKQLATTLGWHSFGQPGLEADDLIGAMVKKWCDVATITVVSGDRDLLQLLQSDVTIALTKKGYSEYNCYNQARFTEEYGILPKQFADVKAFMGDASDGYPGVKGIGEKTALQLIKKHGSVEGVLQAIETLTPAQRRKIEADKEMLKVSHQLAEIHCEAPITTNLEALTIPPFEQAVSQLNEAHFTLVARHIKKG